MEKTVSPKHTRWFSVVGLLLVYAFTRLYQLMSMPLFVDESVYIYRAQLVRQGQLLRPAQHSRILHAWLTALLGPYPPMGGWLARVAIVLAGMLAAAAFYGLVRSLVSHRAGMFALVLWIATPYLFFYERMALADSLLSAVSVIAVYLAWQMICRRERWLALLLGFSLVVVVLAKASGTTWLPLPLVALLLATDLSWRKRIAFAGIAYGTFGVLWGAFTLVMMWRDTRYFGVAERFVGGKNQSFFDRVVSNLKLVRLFDEAYLGVPVIILAVFGALYWLWLKPHRALFAIVALGMGSGAIVVGKGINSRYALNHVAWVVLLAAVGFALVFERHPRWRSALGVTGALWIAFFFMPFALTEWRNPGDLPLVSNDLNEYIQQESSGFAVTEIGDILSAVDEPLPALGFVSNCQALRIAADPVEVACPTLYWDIENAGKLMIQAEEWAQDGPIYVVGEDLPYLDLAALPVPNTVLATATRPGGIRSVSLYLIEQGARQP